ncbi:bromodomain-containing protein DDB_G0278469 [Eurytemora carolleeae]|uniref:bromodomain-containing protein DDB_G0278469 n=1 Tax=Eurytemora carolleeae TaxID=1294199 RepID=UPI000C764F70|nr:bromodomain-containing protein DDB_G0278469 [Eurytemora carolleeae]|eukprot:XP_023342170.1 bromodomain-containing protein DDB_G0278469-like [Eurytemora affinis]
MDVKKKVKIEKMKMSRSMLDVAAYFVAKNRIHNSDDLWFGNENQDDVEMYCRLNEPTEKEENTCDKKEEEEEEEKEEEEEEEEKEKEEDTEIDWKTVLDLIPTTTSEEDEKNRRELWKKIVEEEGEEEAEEEEGATIGQMDEGLRKICKTDMSNMNTTVVQAFYFAKKEADRSQLLFEEFRTFLIGVKQAFQICQVLGLSTPSGEQKIDQAALVSSPLQEVLEMWIGPIENMTDVYNDIDLDGAGSIKFKELLGWSLSHSKKALQG